MKIAVFGQYYQKNTEEALSILLNCLSKKQVSVCVEKSF